MLKFCAPGVNDMTLLLLQMREEMVRFVERERVDVPEPPPRVTALEPSALVLAASRVPDLMRVVPE